MFFSNLATSSMSLPRSSVSLVMVCSACVVVRFFGGFCHRLLAVQRANPSSRRKEKASKTERSMLARLVCLQPQFSLQTTSQDLRLDILINLAHHK
jgi:hypothetical protein